MDIRKVPIVYYPKGVRTVIGEAVVEINNGYFFVDAKIEDANVRQMLSEKTVNEFSLSSKLIKE